MGCGASKDSTAVVNPATQNGNAHPKIKAVSSKSNGNASKGNNTISPDPEAEEAAIRIQANYRGYHTRKNIKMAKPQEEEVDIDLSDPEVQAATKAIQASFRGHQVRRAQEKQEKAKADAELTDKMRKLNTKEEEEELPDLTDPELNKAATKIQSQFKGHLVRKQKGDSPSSK